MYNSLKNRLYRLTLATDLDKMEIPLNSELTENAMMNEMSEQSKYRKLYNKFVRFSEIYIFLCFLIITVVPLFDYQWVPGFIRLIYLTGFPLLLIIVLLGFVKEPLIKYLESRQTTSGSKK
jgi:ABC-type protease/lipase transport system fused ATPase/permease subunit